MPDAGDVDLASVDYVMVTLAHRARRQVGRVRAGLWLGDAEGLQPELAARNLRQVLLFRLSRAVPEERPHGVQLGMCGTGVAPTPVDLF